MDTVSMLNTMRFYCQPILPLVYDESMSYYETLCKVVGQLNTTGDTVNKLNEGLTNEIADRQAADAALDERLKTIESTNAKIHFLIFAGTPPYDAKPVTAMPTRSELRQWVTDGDMIVTLMQTTDERRNIVYAASCAYNAPNWENASFDDFNIIVPISTAYDSEGDYAVRQKIAKITIPPASAASLDEKWGLQFIEINTPSTAANGVVNFAAAISETGSVECNLTPVEFMQLYAPTWANKNLCVAVNAKLVYDGYTRTSSIATLNSTNHLIRIAFERDYGTAITNGVNQLNKTLDYIIGNVSTATWTHETIDSKVFDFPRYEGFQFTRGAGNVITTNDESTPNAVYAQYHSNSSGKIYQNLPTRLIDTVDGDEYWNGTFGIYDDKHMTFTFVTSNYATSSAKMLVRVIELSADVNTTVWKYRVKEFELPFTVDTEMSDTSTNAVQNKVIKKYVDGHAGSPYAVLYTEQALAGSQKKQARDNIDAASDFVIRGFYDITQGVVTAVTLDKTFDEIRRAISYGKTPVLKAGIPPDLHDCFSLAYVDEEQIIRFSAAVADDNKPKISAISILADGSVNFIQKTLLALDSNNALGQVEMSATPNKGMEIATKNYVDDHAAKDAVLYTAQTLTFEQKQRARNNIEALPVAGPLTGGAVSMCPELKPVDSNAAVHVVPSKATDSDYTLTLDCGPENWPVRVKGIKTPTDVDSDAAANVEYVKAKVAGATGATVDTAMSDASTNAVQNKVIKKYVDAAIEPYIIDSTVASDWQSFVQFGSTFEEIYAAIQAGKNVILAMHPPGVSNYVRYAPVTFATPHSIYFYWAHALDTGGAMLSYKEAVITNANATQLNSASLVGLNNDTELPQITMASAPEEDMQIATKQYVDDHASSGSTKVSLSGTVEGEVKGYTSTTYQQIKDEIAKNGNIWLTINGETIRLGSWKQSGSAAYTLNFFGAGTGGIVAKYEVTASATSASLSVTG